MEKSMRKIFVLMAYVSTTLLHSQPSDVSADTVTNYKSWGSKWKAIVMQNNLITLATVPAIGGRVMQYDLGNHSSMYINPSELGKTYTPSNDGQWHNFGGYKTWPSPQSQWPGSWPPPYTLDRANYNFQIDSTSKDSVSVIVTSPVEQWIAPGLRYERKATMYKGSSRVKLEQTMRNEGTSAISWGMWSIMQAIVNHPGETDYQNFWVYFPINPNSVYGVSGVQLPDGSSNAWKGEVVPGVYGVQFYPSSKKIYADPHKGWIAYADLRDSVVYATTFDIFEGAPYPDDARVTVYVNDATTRYLEVEVKAPVVELAAGGGEYTFVENWGTAKVRAPILDVNSVGAIAGKLSYNSETKTLSGIYGVFHIGTARVVCVGSLGNILEESAPLPVSPLAEFQLQEIVDIPDSAKTIEIRIYDSRDILVGILDSAEVLDLVTDIDALDSDRPLKFRLVQNFPNPFNPGTTIAYELPEQSSVKVIIYDLQGREINTFSFVNKSAGYHELLWDGKNNQGSSLSSGIYVYRIQATSLKDGKIFDESAKMTLLK
jgi:hypothetical protein